MEHGDLGIAWWSLNSPESLCLLFRLCILGPTRLLTITGVQYILLNEWVPGQPEQILCISLNKVDINFLLFLLLLLRAKFSYSNQMLCIVGFSL